MREFIKVVYTARKRKIREVSKRLDNKTHRKGHFQDSEEGTKKLKLRNQTLIHSFIILADDRSKASSQNGSST
jgi:hypothetical protein